MTHYYVYYCRDNAIHYERTCGTAERAKERVQELNKWSGVTGAFWTTEVVRGSFY